MLNDSYAKENKNKKKKSDTEKKGEVV